MSDSEDPQGWRLIDRVMQALPAGSDGAASDPADPAVQAWLAARAAKELGDNPSPWWGAAEASTGKPTAPLPPSSPTGPTSPEPAAAPLVPAAATAEPLVPPESAATAQSPVPPGPAASEPPMPNAAAMEPAGAPPWLAGLAESPNPPAGQPPALARLSGPLSGNPSGRPGALFAGLTADPPGPPGSPGLSGTLGGLSAQPVAPPAQSAPAPETPPPASLPPPAPPAQPAVPPPPPAPPESQPAPPILQPVVPPTPQPTAPATPQPAAPPAPPPTPPPTPAFAAPPTPASAAPPTPASAAPPTPAFAAPPRATEPAPAIFARPAADLAPLPAAPAQPAATRAAMRRAVRNAAAMAARTPDQVMPEAPQAPAGKPDASADDLTQIRTDLSALREEAPPAPPGRLVRLLRSVAVVVVMVAAIAAAIAMLHLGGTPAVEGVLIAPQISMAAPLAGRITTVAASPGAKIADGATLFDITPPTVNPQRQQALTAGLGDARARIAQLDQQIADLTALLNEPPGNAALPTPAATQATNDEIQLQLVSLRSQRDAAAAEATQDANALTAMATRPHGPQIVRSPAAGLVWTLAVTEGDTVPRGAVLGEIADCAHITVALQVPASQMARLRPGSSVQVRLKGTRTGVPGLLQPDPRAQAQPAPAGAAQPSQPMQVIMAPGTVAQLGGGSCPVGRQVEVRAAPAAG